MQEKGASDRRFLQREAFASWSRFEKDFVHRLKGHFIASWRCVRLLKSRLLAMNSLATLSTNMGSRYAPGTPLRMLTIEPTAKHTATVVFFHGFGDTGAKNAARERIVPMPPLDSYLFYHLPILESKSIAHFPIEGMGWEFLADAIAPHMPHVKWILPHAHMRKISMFDGQLAHAWYDLPKKREGEEGQRRSEETLKESIAQGALQQRTKRTKRLREN